MAKRGIYSKLEQQVLDDFRARADKVVGWLGDKPVDSVPYPVMHRTASKDLILHMAYAADYWNPLWRDEEYAKKTRWGGLVAPPFFQQCIQHGGPRYYLNVPPELGIIKREMGGNRWEFFKPIYLNDTFRVWAGNPKIIDVSDEEESAPRKFRIISEVSYINQRDEITGMLHQTHYFTILPPGSRKQEAPLKFTSEYVYTHEELDKIEQLEDTEVIRGSEIRYWENVQTGDKLTPVIYGPITAWDQVMEIQGFGLATLPTREARRVTRERMILDKVTNISHKGIEFHLTSDVAKAMGMPSTTIIAVTVEHIFGRLITNWMGDDGFIRTFNYTKLFNTSFGDTVLARGKVIGKRVSDDGGHLVDIDVWMESIRGYIPNVASISVLLPSREDVFEKDKPILI